MELSLSQLIMKIVDDTQVRSVCIRIFQGFAELMIQKRGTGQYVVTHNKIELSKVADALQYFVKEVGMITSGQALPSNMMTPFKDPVIGIAIPALKTKIDYDIMLTMYWNGPFGNYVFTRQISNKDKAAMDGVSKLFEEQINSDEILRNVVIK